MLCAGVDEVGRGALFGAVVACAVILPADCAPQLIAWGVKDSKKLSPRKRQVLATQIQELAIAWGIGTATPAEIDQLNILQATFWAMERAIMALTPRPEHIWVDGNQPIPFRLIEPIPQTTMIRGDSSNLSIACASILAKVWRDRLIEALAKDYPQYDLAQNKGYGTAKHRQAIREYGYTPLHRHSFRLAHSE